MIKWRGKIILEIKDLYVGMLVGHGSIHTSKYRPVKIEKIIKRGETDAYMIYFADDDCIFSDSFWEDMYERHSPEYYHNIYYIEGYTILKEDTAIPSEPNLSSEGLANCPKCECPTEPQRDFLTFRVREFCPRCRI